MKDLLIVLVIFLVAAPLVILCVYAWDSVFQILREDKQRPEGR